MKAIKHKPTGKWLISDDSDEYVLSEDCYPFNSFGTDQQIAEEVEIISDGGYMADDIEIVTVHVLTDADLEAKEMEAFQAGCNAAIKHCDENGFGPTTDDMYKWWKEAQQ